ncbi:MAG TPA: hypothetical protein VHW01_15110 [Polyangiaceae bacterium]|jgi:hypothetical protein|nr:hypothetical protein [Polyangiaceae bacterium]
MHAHSRRAWLTTAGAGALWLTEGRAVADTVRLQLITAKANAIRDLSVADLRQVYRGKQVLIGGTKLVPFNHPPNTPDRVAFDRIVLGMSPEEVGRYWIDQKIRGGDSPPRIIDSVALLVRVVGALPGAIAYVREGFSSPDLKVVTLEGRLPNDPRYPLTY